MTSGPGPQAHVDVRRHVQRVRYLRRDVGVHRHLLEGVACPTVDVRRVDGVVDRAGMQRLAREHLAQHGLGLLEEGGTIVGDRRLRHEREAVQGRVSRSSAKARVGRGHALAPALDPLPVLSSVGLGEERARRLDQRRLAGAAGEPTRPLAQLGAPLEDLRPGPTWPQRLEQRRGDAPVGHGARRVGVGHGLEPRARLLVHHVVHQAEGAVEVVPDLDGAFDLEVDVPERRVVGDPMLLVGERREWHRQRQRHEREPTALPRASLPVSLGRRSRSHPCGARTLPVLVFIDATAASFRACSARPNPASGGERPVHRSHRAVDRSWCERDVVVGSGRSRGPTPMRPHGPQTGQRIHDRRGERARTGPTVGARRSGHRAPAAGRVPICQHRCLERRRRMAPDERPRLPANVASPRSTRTPTAIAKASAPAGSCSLLDAISSASTAASFASSVREVANARSASPRPGAASRATPRIPRAMMSCQVRARDDDPLRATSRAPRGRLQPRRCRRAPARGAPARCTRAPCSRAAA
jgi:hypothetical protein